MFTFALFSLLPHTPQTTKFMHHHPAHLSKISQSYFIAFYIIFRQRRREKLVSIVITIFVVQFVTVCLSSICSYYMCTACIFGEGFLYSIIIQFCLENRKKDSRLLKISILIFNVAQKNLG